VEQVQFKVGQKQTLTGQSAKMLGAKFEAGNWLDLVTVAAPPASFTAPRRASATGMRDLMGLRKSKLSVRVLDGLSRRRWKLLGGSNPRNRTNNYRQNHHPTVKPTDLMRYLCRLITPPNGTVLDPFMGSGSTGKAAMYEGFKFIGVEMTDEYLPIAKARIEFAVSDNEGFLL
jgi:hypothetical protein